MKAWVLRETRGFDGLHLVDLPEPERGPRELLVQVTASALNYRDTLLLKGGYGSQQERANLIPGGDGAGRVVAPIPRVTQFAVGGRVIGNLYWNWVPGRPTEELLRVIIGARGPAQRPFGGYHRGQPRGSGNDGSRHRLQVAQAGGGPGLPVRGNQGGRRPLRRTGPLWQGLHQRPTWAALYSAARS